MNSTLKDAQAPNHRECLLPSVARTPSVIQVTPAKKITFLKRGDPRFAGVRLAVNQRTFKTFSALMDELSQRMPLSFGVRSVTTPRGLHGLSTLEQLEDGGCYLCSDKKPPKTPNGPSRPQGRSPSGHQSRDLEGQRETPRTSSSRKGPKVPRKIKLIKNGDPRFQGTVVLSHGNTRNLAAFVSKASDVLRFPVKQVYTVSGKKVDSLQSLLRSPSILVCAGNEAFRPPAMNEAGKHGTEVLSGPTSRNKIGSWGPKAQQSVIHSRSTSGSRPRWFSLLSEKPGVSDAPRSLHRAWVGPALDRHPQDTSAQPQPGALVAGDDMEKKVHVNEDGSLSVEMRVRFHLLGDDMLLWSRRLGRASGLTAAGGADPGLGEADDVRCMWQGHPWGFVEPGARGQRPCEAGCDTAFDRSCQPGPRCEIWTNPLYATQDEDPASRSGAGRAQHSCCRGPWSPGAAGGDRSSQDSGSLASSARCFEGSEPDSSCCPRSLEGSVGSVSLHQASAAASQSQAAGEGPGEGPSSEPEGAEPGSQDQCSCLTPGNQGVEGALSDPSARARSCAEPRERGEQHQGCLGKSRARAPQQKATQGDGSGSPTPSPSSLRNEGLQKCGQVSEHHQARSGSITRLSLALSHPSSWDTEGGSLPLSAYASAQQRSPASAMSSPNVSDLDQVALRGHPGKCCHCRDTCCPLDSPATQQVPRPPDRGGACAHSPALRSERSPSNRRQASRALRPPSSGSLHSQDLPGVSSATITPVSNSDCASSFYRPDAPSAAPSADTCQGEKARATPEPASSLALLVRQAAGGEPRAHRGCCCSQIRTPGKTRVLWGPHSEACWVCSGYCPMPPRGRPCARKRPSSSSSSSSSELRADQGPGGGEQGQGKLQVGRSLPRAVDRTARAARRSSPSAGTGPRGVFRGRSPGGGHRIKEQEEEGSMMPGALPHTSPDAMVREWLDNIPEEPVLMKYEMIDETPSVAGDGLEGPEEDLGDQHSLEGLGELVQARQQPLEGDAGDNPEPMTADAGSRSGDGPPQVAATDGDFDTPLEAGAGEKFAMCCGVTQCELPGRVSASTQIMKALMGSKQGRPSSLPEVSSVVARRLSRSARALITCLARLHLFDEDLGSPGGKARFTNSPRYQELLNISQALWPGYGLDQGQLDSDLWELAPCQALPGLGSHAVTEDFTATSSSGVDVSSGSGGSGEGSGPCAVDCTLVPERVELPLETSYQRPDSRSSENPEDLENHQSNCSTVSSKSQASACASSEEEGERDGGEQMLDNNLEPPQMLDENLEPSQVLDDNLESFQETEGGAASQQGEEKSHTSAVSCLEEAEVEAQGKSEEEGAVDEGSGDEDNLGSVAAGEDDQAPEESDGAEAVETQEAGGEERPESEGGNESEKEDSPPDSRGHSQSGEAPGNSSLDLEGRSTPHPGPGGDTSHQSPDPDTGPSSRASSLGHCSQVSQKDSEDHSSVNRSTEDEPKEDPPAESKAPGMYPESSTSEQEGTPSGLQTPEQGADEGSDLQDKKAAANLTLTKAVGKAEGFDQDDFDF
ncbi:Retinitis pigmentosa 1-like 1 protein [Tupaia chinensis]|uniref:Retinitis pigmentosa 1-like 1 protein n=1 Tax=Tupaia chinensis TaxID=246437 RepID=L8YCR8_TUPCH|nr:Retinitis pigmentosa 1-like 1 protein [Tupaia chinensis]